MLTTAVVTRSSPLEVRAFSLLASAHHNVMRRKRLNKYYPDYSKQDRTTKFRIGCVIHLCEPEIIEDLELLGYKTDTRVDYNKHTAIITYKSGLYFPQEEVSLSEEEKTQWIDCGKSKKEFWLLTGISNETLYRRVFIRRGRWRVCKDKWAVCLQTKRPPQLRTCWREAKVEEIVAAFRDDLGTSLEDYIPKTDDKWREGWRHSLTEFTARYGTDFLLY